MSVLPSLVSAPTWGPTEWTLLSGPDARDFLHRLTSADVRSLEIGQGAPGCFLTPQGKVMAAFWLWCLDEQTFAFEYPSGHEGEWKRSLLGAIDQFTFAEKMQLTDSPASPCSWILTDRPVLSARAEEFRSELRGELRLNQRGSVTYGRVLTSIWGDPKLAADLTRSLGARDAPHADWLTSRIQAVQPDFGHEIRRDVSPLDVGMESFIADQKGCYPGQEVIEKIVALGSPPRRLVAIEFAEGAQLSVDDPVLDGATEVGKLTTVSGQLALAVVRKTHAKAGQTVSAGQSSGTILKTHAHRGSK